MRQFKESLVSEKKRKYINLPTLERLKKEKKKRGLESSLFSFLKWTFEIRNEVFVESWHHRVICYYLELVYELKLLHLIITLPPRYTKTEIVIKAFTAWCIAKNPKSLFLHLSYSDELALDNSSEVRELISHEAFQEFWPIDFKADSDAKKKWYTENGGGMYAAATGGQVTGFGAGSMDKSKFGGAVLIDDPIKPEDALYSDTTRTKINKRFNGTIKSRLNSTSTPIILIMQRLHEEDLAGFLLEMGSEYKFFHLNLPAINETGPNEYDPRQIGEALWPEKHSLENLNAMRLADPETFTAQYQQEPSPPNGHVIQDEHIRYYDEIPKDIICRVHSWDFTFKEKSRNKNQKTDYVVGYEWALTSTKNIFLMPYETRDRMGFEKSLEAFIAFQDAHPDPEAFLVEDKANGAAIIDVVKKKIKRVIEIEPKGSKLERLSATVPLWRDATIWLPSPKIAPWIKDYVVELKKFPKGKNDDRVDASTQAIEYLEKKMKTITMGQANPGRRPTYRKTFEDKFKKSGEYKSKIRF